jgi:hypothetical protein
MIKKRKELKEREQLDSLQLTLMLSDMLRAANKHKNELKFYQDFGFDNSHNVASGNLTYGHLFEKGKKHLIISRNINSSKICIDIFVLEKTKFRLIWSQVLDGMTYLNDSIKDVNGDHEKDFLIHWYPSSGCCRRDIYDVYLYQKDKGDFTEKYEFINPTFAPSEKIIRGIGYGQPGDVELYKYKWNGLKIDTVEFIRPDTMKQKYHVYLHWGDYDNQKEGKFVVTVPKEFQKIAGYNWFEGNY